MRTRFAALLLATALVLPSAAMAQDARQPAPRLVVTGEGEVSVAPDMAIVSLAVMRDAETAREALDANNQAMAAVIAAMKEAGIAPRDLQTAGLQINPRYVYPQDGHGQPRITGYEVTNSLTVRVRDIAQVGQVIDRSVTLGVNQGGSITFTNDDPGQARTEARKLAVHDAIERARTLADAAGAEVGTIMEIVEQAPDQPVAIAARAMRMEAAPDAVPIEAGENSYRIRVSVTFELKQ